MDVNVQRVDVVLRRERRSSRRSVGAQKCSGRQPPARRQVSGALRVPHDLRNSRKQSVRPHHDRLMLARAVIAAVTVSHCLAHAHHRNVAVRTSTASRRCSPSVATCMVPRAYRQAAGKPQRHHGSGAENCIATRAANGSRCPHRRGVSLHCSWRAAMRARASGKSRSRSFSSPR